MTRRERFVGLLIFMGLVISSGIAAFYWQQSRINRTLADVTVVTDQASQPAAEIAPQVAYEGVTALYGAPLATGNRFNQFAEDALVIGASATWIPVPDETTLRKGTAGWHYTLYSPSLQQAIEATALSPDEVVYGSPRIVETPISAFPTQNWVIDSPAVMRQFLDGGGLAFLQTHRDVSLGMTAQLITDSGKPEIVIAAVDNSTGDTLTVWYDGTFGNEIRRLQVP